jgi:transcriptional regulator with XRE-family HTH domain
MATVTYPRLVLRSLGLSLRLCRIVLGLTQRQAGELMGLAPTNADHRVVGWEKGDVRLDDVRLTNLADLLERACTYAAQQYGMVQNGQVKLPPPNDPEYALKLFKYWQAHDGTKAGLRRLIPYLAARDTPRRRMNPVPHDRNLSSDPRLLDLEA